MTRRRWVALALAALAACDVPSERSAVRVPARDVPFELVATTTTSRDESPDQRNDQVRVFLVRDDHLAVVVRSAPPADPGTVLALLAAGPTPDEVAGGLRTALVTDLATISAVSEELITIDLDDEFSALAPGEQRLALAQITFTMTQLDSVSRVQFLVGGQLASVPRGDGSSTDSAVQPVDYAEVAPD